MKSPTVITFENLNTTRHHALKRDNRFAMRAPADWKIFVSTHQYFPFAFLAW